MSNSLILPPSQGGIVRVSVIQAGKITISAEHVVSPTIPGVDTLEIPCFSFLIESDKLGKKVVYDLGLMKSWKDKLPPKFLSIFEDAGVIFEVSEDVSDILTRSSVPLSSIDSIIWSHHHIDHIGDPSGFPKSTSLIVGPGFKSNKKVFPGYPLNEEATTCQDAFDDREIVELDFSQEDAVDIGGFKAIDLFKDGSLYVLECSGHTRDHLCALARISDSKFLFLGGDAAHHAGEFRPSSKLPLPESITPSPFEHHSSLSVCPGSLFEHIHPASKSGKDFRTTPFYEVTSETNESVADAISTVDKMKDFDASPDVFVIIAHDESLLDIIPFYPDGAIASWERDRKESNKELGRWRFLKNFQNIIEVKN